MKEKKRKESVEEKWRYREVNCGSGVCSLACLRLETDILRLNLVFSPCRVVQNVAIYKNVIWPLPCYWEPAQRGQFSSLGGECTK